MTPDYERAGAFSSFFALKFRSMKQEPWNKTINCPEFYEKRFGQFIIRGQLSWFGYLPGRKIKAHVRMCLYFL